MNRVSFLAAKMPVLKNPRWEKFAQGLVSGLSQHVAFLAAGYERKRSGGKASANIRSDASKLFKRTEVRLRIAELQREAAKDAKISLQDLIKQLDADWRLAHRSKQPGAAVGATMGKAKLLGFVIDKAEVDATLRKPSRRPVEDKKISLQEWQEKFQPKLDEREGAP
jgi:hypothetical protein